MSDDDLLIRVPVPESPSEAKGVKAKTWISVIALVISLASALFTGLQFREAWKLRRLAWRPRLEITNAEFENPMRWEVILKNSGTLTAMKPRGTVLIFKYIKPGEYGMVDDWVAQSETQNVSTGDTNVRMLFSLPDPFELKKAGLQMPLELRGNVAYQDEEGNQYSTPFCFYVFKEPSIPGPPLAGLCPSETGWPDIRK